MSDLSMTGKPRPRLKADAYDTIDADWIVPVLLRHVKFPDVPHGGPIWEPAAGASHISNVLHARGFGVVSTDIKPRGKYVVRGDFFQTGMPDHCKHIITNPPYSIADEFIRRALEQAQTVKGKVAMLMRSEWHSAARRGVLVHTHPAFEGVIVLTRRPKWFTTNEDSPRHNFSWFVWDWSRPTGLPWIRYDQ